MITEEKTLDEAPIPENPEVVIFASYKSSPKHPCKISILGENVSEVNKGTLEHILLLIVCTLTVWDVKFVKHEAQSY